MIRRAIGGLSRRGVTVACASLSLLAGGCLTVTTGQMAETLGTGHLQMGLEPATWSGTNDYFQTTGEFNLAVRYGVSPRVDVGARVGTAAAELSTKVRLTHPGSRGPIVSIAPDIGLSSGGPVGLLYLQVPVLLGFPVGSASEIVVAPKLLAWHFLTGRWPWGGSGDTLAVGGSLGVALRLAPGFHVLPEVAVAQPLLTSPPPPRPDPVGGFIGDQPNDGTLVQFQVAILIGG